ncbi:MAG: flagellar hook-basal body protein [Nibricoccus sp.]
MNIGVYQSAASLTALERWQDVTAQNVTASQVTGYRKRTVEFSGVPMGAIEPDPGKNKIGNGDTPQPLFPKAEYGVSFKNGENYPTQRPLDFAIEGNGFFELKRPDGSLTYTRAGSFHISPERTLVSSDGYELLNKDGSPVQLVAGAGELAVVEDGLLVQGTTQLGRIGLKNFSSPSDLTPVAAGFFDPKEGAEAVDVENSLIIQGNLEGSNVTPMQEMIALVQIARAYEANQKSMTTQDQILGRAIESLG